MHMAVCRMEVMATNGNRVGITIAINNVLILS